MAVVQAARLGLTNFSVLVSHVLVPPAMRAVLGSPSNRVQGFLAAGHVCAIMGTAQYEPIAEKYHVPIVVTGFEPLDILQGVLMCVRQLEEGRAEVENQYARAVRREGNRAALQILNDVFEVVPRKWRGIGEIPAERLVAPRGLRPVRRRSPFRRRPHHGRGAGGVHRRAGLAGSEEAARVYGLRRPLHAGSSPRRPDGVVGRGVFGLLSLSPAGKLEYVASAVDQCLFSRAVACCMYHLSLTP